jgi:BirA family transcriptional regulator, biotin operon repressor / biotin---[acetyl-CoA-carboxylase] ligase
MSAGRAVHWFPSIGSTMQAASELAERGCPSGTVIGADEQTAGRGRYGRAWHSEPNSGLYMSEVLRLRIPPETLPIVTLALGLAVTEAILTTTGMPCDLRWPNDVMAAGKKCAGILVQLHGDAIIAGIGINVNQTAFPDELKPLATSLRIVSGREQSRDDLLRNLLVSVDSFIEILTTGGKDPILRMFSEASSYVRGRRVIVDQGSAILEGTTEGLDPSGFLILRKNDGQRTLILAGGVRPAQ